MMKYIKFAVKKTIACFSFLILVTGGFVQAQINPQYTTQGTEFWLAFGQNGFAMTPNGGEFNDFGGGGAVPYHATNLTVRVAASRPDTIKFTFTETGAVHYLYMPEGGVKDYSLSDAHKLLVYTPRGTSQTSFTTPVTSTNSKSVRIESRHPVSLYALNYCNYSSDATNVLPSDGLGTAYYHISYKPYKGGGQTSFTINSFDGYLIVATQDNTEVFRNSSKIAALNKGQVYYYYSGTDTDLTGAVYITTSKPVAYFVNNTGTRIPSTSGATEILFQQLMPINTWGTRFLVPSTNRKKDIIRVVASANGTEVTFTGGSYRSGGTYVSGNRYRINQGKYLELEVENTDNGVFISSGNNPVAVCAYLVGNQYAEEYGSQDPNQGDPAMTWIMPVEQSLATVAISPFKSANMAHHYAIIIAVTGYESHTVVTKGASTDVPLTGSVWKTNSGYSFYRLDLSSDPDKVYTFTNLYGLMVLSYGYGTSESYYYLAGSAIRTINPHLRINDIHYQDIQDCVFCNNNIEVKGRIYSRSTDADYLQWVVDGVERTGLQADSSWNVSNLSLAPGDHEIKMIVKNLGSVIDTCTYNFSIESVAVSVTGAKTINLGQTTTVSTNLAGGAWTSSNTGVATVDATGKVTAVGGGTASFTYTTVNGCSATTESITVLNVPVTITYHVVHGSTEYTVIQSQMIGTTLTAPTLAALKTAGAIPAASSSYYAIYPSWYQNSDFSGAAWNFTTNTVAGEMHLYTYDNVADDHASFQRAMTYTGFADILVRGTANMVSLTNAVTVPNGGRIVALRSYDGANKIVNAASAKRHLRIAGAGNFSFDLVDVLLRGRDIYPAAVNPGGGISAIGVTTFALNASGTGGMSHCYASSISDLNGGYGGALYLQGGTGTIGSGVYHSNGATEDGGAFYFYTTTATISNVTISGNRAKNGGGIGVGNSSNLTIGDGVKIQGNYVSWSGGGIFVISSGSPTLTINGGATGTIIGGARKFTTVEVTAARGVHGDVGNCSAINNTNTGGGGLYTSSPNYSISNCTFSYNYTTYRGGAIGIQTSGGTKILDNIIFNNNEAGQRGGAIDNMSSNFDLTFNDCIFNDNRTTAGADANRYGGAIHSDGSNQVYTFNNTQFNRNRASQVGGALCIFGTVTTNDCVFSENYGDRYGGAIYAATEWKPTKLIINNTTFENNTTNAWGGAIYTTDTLKITGGTFSGNKAWQSGGAIHVTGYHAKLDIFKGSDGAYPLFVDNWAGYAAPWMTTDPTTTWTRFQTIYATEVPSDFPLSHISLNVGGKVRGTDYDNLYNDYDINLPVAKLRYNANNEAIDANNETYTEYYYWLAPYNEATILNNMFTPKPGATFLNWATTKTGTGTIYEPGDTRTFTEFEVGYSVGMPVGYIDLYAQWEIAPCVAVDDYAQALSGSITAVPVIVDVLANDDLASCNASSIPLTIPIAPKNGTATVTLDNKIEFTAIADYEGADSLQYSINCNGSIDAAWLYITIVRALVPTITIAADPVSPICAGTSVVFTAAITNGGTTPEYRWTVNGSDAGTNADTYSYVPANGDEIVCELTSSSSIAYPVIVSSNVITMIVYPLSTPSMITVTGAATCSGKTATMMASTTDITNPTFRWYATATSDDLLSMENPFTTPALTGNTKYYLTVSGDNYCESVERKEVEVAIDCYTVSGTVFPFVHKLLEGGNADDEFNALFPVTAALYAAPPAMSDNPIGDLLRNEALFTMEAIYYDGSYYVPGAPKNPGYQGSANNPGSTILWSKIGKTQGEIDTTPLSGVGDIPNSDIGLYVFEDVPTGEYLLLLRRQGFSIRIAEVSVYSDTIVEHKELVAGDINTDRVVNVFDMSLINSKSPAMIGQSKYDPKFDLNGDGLVDTNDVELLGGNMGFSLYLYFDTMKWVLGL